MVLLRFGLEDVTEYDSLDTGPLSSVLVEHLLEKSDKVLGHGIWVLRNLVMKNLALQLPHVTAVEDEVDRPPLLRFHLVVERASRTDKTLSLWKTVCFLGRNRRLCSAGDRPLLT